jgi:hypothetical protein
VRGVGLEEWSRLVKERSLYLTPRWLASLERHPSFSEQYLVAKDEDGVVIGVLPSYLAHEAGPEAYDPFRTFVAPLSRGQPLAHDWTPTLLGGTRAAYVNEFPVADHLSSQEATEARAALLGAFTDLASSVGAKCLAFMYLTRRGLDEFLPFFDEKTPVLLTAADAWLKIAWDHFDDYVRWLSTGRRSIVRRDLARFEKSRCVVEQARLADCYSEAGPLLAQLLQRYGGSAKAEAMVELLWKQAQVLDDKSVVFLARRDGLVVGFALYYEWGGVFHARTAGFDYSASEGTGVYFKLVFYEPIRYAIERNLGWLHLGTESYEAKVLRGAHLDPLWSVVMPSQGKQWAASQADAWNQHRFQSLKEDQGKAVSRVIDASWLSSPHVVRYAGRIARSRTTVAAPDHPKTQ